jgi:hypothetical protein
MATQAARPELVGRDESAAATRLLVLPGAAAMLFTLAPPTMLRETIAAAARWQRRGRELSLLRHFGQIGTNSPGNASGF